MEGAEPKYTGVINEGQKDVAGILEWATVIRTFPYIRIRRQQGETKAMMSRFPLPPLSVQGDTGDA